jgi:hypothetical protein
MVEFEATIGKGSPTFIEASKIYLNPTFCLLQDVIECVEKEV